MSITSRRALAALALLLTLGCPGSPTGTAPDAGTPGTDGATPPAAATCTSCPSGQVCGGGGIPSRCGTRVPVCSDGFCWANPLPQGNTLHGVWARSRTDVFAVGDFGTLLHWTGERLESMASPTRRNLKAVWGTPGGPDVWAVGEDSVILHYDGTAWTAEYGPLSETRSTDLVAVHGTSTTDVWAVGNSGRILHRTAAGWSVVTGASSTTPPYTGVFAVSPSDVYVVGGSTVTTATLLHWNGTSWQPQGLPDDPWAVWASGPNDVWVVGPGGVFGGLTYHWNGQAWSTATTTGTGTAISGSSASDVWVVGDSYLRHFDGAKWNTVQLPVYTELNAVAAAAPDAVWAVGEHGALWFYDGQRWAEASSGDTDALNRISTLSGAGGHVWGAGRYALAHFDGQHWTFDRRFGANDVWAVAADDVWFAGSSPDRTTVYHWNGTTLETVLDTTEPGGVSGFGELTHIWAAPGGEVWASGFLSGKALRRTGGAWSVVDLPLRSGGATASVGDIAGKAGEMYVVGDYVRRYDGVQWSEPAGAPASATSIWTGDTVWLSAATTYYRWDGTSFTAMGSPPTSAGPGQLVGSAGGELYSLTRRGNTDLGTPWSEPTILRRSDAGFTFLQPPAVPMAAFAHEAGAGFDKARVWVTVGDYGEMVVLER